MEPKRHAMPERPADRSPTGQSGNMPRVTQSGNMPRVSPSGNMPRVTQPTSASAEWKAAREDVLVRLMFTPGSSPLEATHAFLSTYTAERLSPSVSQRVCLAAYELLSNATNYATLGSDVVLEIV